MLKPILLLFFLFSFLHAPAQEKRLDTIKIKEDLNKILNDISENYIYLQEKKVDTGCIWEYYTARIKELKTEDETVLFFEYLLDEFYDSHLILNTNRKASFRLNAPIYATMQKGKFIVANVWQTEVTNLDQNIIGATLTKINGIDIENAIAAFPTHCNNKNLPEVREWILNKLLAGRYNGGRIVTMEWPNGKTFEINLDTLRYKKNDALLTSEKRAGVGIIRINNSLGNNNLITAFDKALDSLSNTKALIIDLRNTVDGGNSYVARGIMSRFISATKPYQKHQTKEQYGTNPVVERSWVEYVSPRGATYTRPVIILVGRWTGSMGEGLAIGFEGMQRAKIVGTEMERLAGEMYGFSFRYQDFGYRLSIAKLYHVNGTRREAYVPTHYVKQTTNKKDEILERAFQLLKTQIK